MCTMCPYEELPLLAKLYFLLGLTIRLPTDVHFHIETHVWLLFAEFPTVFFSRVNGLTDPGES